MPEPCKARNGNERKAQVPKTCHCL
jgi:hypothetical protein